MADWDKDKPADNDLVSQFPSNERDARDAVRVNFQKNHHAGDDADVGKHEIIEILANATPTAASGQGNFYTKDVGSGQIELFHQDEAGNELQLTDRGKPRFFPNLTGDVNATQSELNRMDGITASTAELNKVDGFTGSASDLNNLSGRSSASIWGSDNDGGGSGLNADMVDGQHASAFFLNAHLPSGTKMVFYQASAPTGWTQDTSVTDRVLRVVDGSGGGTGGSWTISGVTVDGHQLSVSEMPSHNHGGGNHDHTVRTWSSGNQDTASIADELKGTTLGTDNLTPKTANSGTIINSEGGGGSHSHGLTADGNWRPEYIDVIVATKD